MWADNTTVKKIFAKANDIAYNGRILSTFFNFFMGRCTFAAIVFSIVGIYGWLHGKDLTSYAMFVTAIQGLLVLHSWKEDIAEQNQVRRDRDGEHDAQNDGH